MDAIELLREDAKTERIYRSDSVYIDWIQDSVNSYTERFPEQDWSQCCRVVSGTPGRTEYDLAVNHLIHWGYSNANILEKHWKIALPSWIHEFYSQVQMTALAWRNFFDVLSPEQIIQVEDEHREWHDNKSLPVRLIRFAQVWLSGDYFALRQSVRDNQWRIMYVSHEEPTAYFQDASMDGSEDDEDINVWMERMIKTDGYPAIKGNEEFETPFMERVG